MKKDGKPKNIECPISNVERKSSQLAAPVFALGFLLSALSCICLWLAA
jgi:hypothetical protein